MYIWKFKTRIVFLSLETDLSVKILFQMWWVSQTTCSAGRFWSQFWADMKSLNKGFIKWGEFFIRFPFTLLTSFIMNWILESSWYQNSHGLKVICKVLLMPLTLRKYEVPFADLYGLRQAELSYCCPRTECHRFFKKQQVRFEQVQLHQLLQHCTSVLKTLGNVLVINLRNEIWGQQMAISGKWGKIPVNQILCF